MFSDCSVIKHYTTEKISQMTFWICRETRQSLSHLTLYISHFQEYNIFKGVIWKGRAFVFSKLLISILSKITLLKVYVLYLYKVGVCRSKYTLSSTAHIPLYNIHYTVSPCLVQLWIVWFCILQKFSNSTTVSAKEEGSRFRHFGGFELDFTMFRY